MDTLPNSATAEYYIALNRKYCFHMQCMRPEIIRIDKRMLVSALSLNFKQHDKIENPPNSVSFNKSINYCHQICFLLSHKFFIFQIYIQTLSNAAIFCLFKWSVSILSLINLFTFFVFFLLCGRKEEGERKMQRCLWMISRLFAVSCLYNVGAIARKSHA